MRKLFVTGIGTNVGKTIASAILTEALQADYWKPVQCGYSPMRDSELIVSLISNRKSRVHPERFCFEQALSPHIAAELSGVRIELSDFALPVSDNSTMIIEGAGGLMVPLNEQDLMADLIARLDAEVIVVADFYLGSINHTLLTCIELKRRKLKVVGILFCGEYVEASANIILKQTGLKKIGIIAHEPNIDKSAIARYAGRFGNL
jgi:dethiobiotin synthetase